MITMKTPLFRLGQVVATPGAIRGLKEAGQCPWDFLARHASGDWGDLDEEDRHLNDEAVQDGSRILSAYQTAKGEKIWVITEADRSVTTILLPSSY